MSAGHFILWESFMVTSERCLEIIILLKEKKKLDLVVIWMKKNLTMAPLPPGFM